MSKGFLVFAQNSKYDYLRLAYGLALSLKKTQSKFSNLSVAVTPGQEVPVHMREAFDQVIDIPWGDAAADTEWKLENEWKAYHLTPYEETIKLEADMLVPVDMSDWWKILGNNDVWMASRTITYRGEDTVGTPYRNLFETNKLPNTYTAFMYWKKSEAAKQLFDMAELIYQNREHFYYEFLNEDRDNFISTDVAFALAQKLLNVNYAGDEFPLIHMKSLLQNAPIRGDDWTLDLPMTVAKDGSIKIGRFSQKAPLHYHVKSALTDDMIERLK